MAKVNSLDKKREQLVLLTKISSSLESTRMNKDPSSGARRTPYRSKMVSSETGASMALGLQTTQEEMSTLATSEMAKETAKGK